MKEEEEVNTSGAGPKEEEGNDFVCGVAASGPLPPSKVAWEKGKAKAVCREEGRRKGHCPLSPSSLPFLPRRNEQSEENYDELRQGEKRGREEVSGGAQERICTRKSAYGGWVGAMHSRCNDVTRG